MSILEILRESTATPKQIADRLDESVRLVCYHIEKLKEVGCVELVSERQKGPTAEHFYRATERQFFDDAGWSKVSSNDRAVLSTTILQLISEDLGETLSAGMFDERPNNHLTRLPMVLDEKGWSEVVAELKRTLAKLLAIQEKSTERLLRSRKVVLMVKVVLMQFLSPQKR
jgi:predicted ArsR family transcriptional regulator